MKVREVKKILESCSDEMDVAVEQIFREQRSITLRSVEIVNNCVIFKDHTVRMSERSVFQSFDGNVFEVPNEWENLVSDPH